MESNMNDLLFRRCPGCGSDRVKADSAKSMVCSVCGFVYFFNPAAAVAALITNPENELLVTVRAHDPGKGLWDLPGGFVDPGETAEAALRREVREELNLEIDAMTYFCSVPNVYVYKAVTYTTLDLAFVCEVTDFSPLAAMDDIEAVLFAGAKEPGLERFAFDSTRTIVSRFRVG